MWLNVANDCNSGHKKTIVWTKENTFIPHGNYIICYRSHMQTCQGIVFLSSFFKSLFWNSFVLLCWPIQFTLQFKNPINNPYPLPSPNSVRVSKWLSQLDKIKHFTGYLRKMITRNIWEENTICQLLIYCK